MKKLTKKQQLLLVLIAFSVIWYFVFRKKSTDESGYDSSWTNIGDGFFIPNDNTINLSKKYIDGTVSDGYLINSNGEYRGGDFEAFSHTRKYIPYPKDKGFTKGDGKGNYFYFDPLSDLQLQEINRLITAANIAAQLAAQQQAAQQASDKAAQLAAQQQAEASSAAQKAAALAAAQQAAAMKAIADQKTAQANQAAQQAASQIAAAQQKSAEEKTKQSNNIIIIIAVIILIAIISYFIWRKKHQNS